MAFYGAVKPASTGRNRRPSQLVEPTTRLPAALKAELSTQLCILSTYFFGKRPTEVPVFFFKLHQIHYVVAMSWGRMLMSSLLFKSRHNPCSL